MMPVDIRKRLSSYVEPYGLFMLGSKALLKAWFNALLSVDFSTLLNFSLLRDRAFGNLNKEVDARFFAFEQEYSPVPQLVGSAYGTVLDLGPAAGNQITRFDKSRVQKIYGVEPMESMHGRLKKRIEENGWGEHYVQMIGGVEDGEMLTRVGVTEASVDCVVSIQVLCSVSDPELVVRKLYALLKPGGELIFWEHHESHDWLTRWVQCASLLPFAYPKSQVFMIPNCKSGLWNWVWPLAIGGCRLDRPTTKLLLGAGGWGHVKIDGDEEPWLLRPRVWGRLVKARDGDGTR